MKNMKKHLLLFLLPIFFFACEKDEPKDEQFSLKGKTYSAYAYDHTDPYLGTTTKVYYVYRFLNNNTAERTARKNEPHGALFGNSVDTCIYTLNYPNLEIKVPSPNGTSTYTKRCEFISEKIFREYNTQGFYEYKLVE
ncbi:MAG: hypothetical protein ACK5MH_09175 [Bacteroidales bacterium]